ncbi:hypothetical protein GZ77_08740 [Endozoicomonas montiporae]|uniref:Pilus assembly protein PilW n=2 Tax=Endozoicomonas montiporae TaxID=1027273 RepID=A0A081N7M0_9GAMM|nr:hypothetical protein GZ77_08740 [Endozoicomonas montiporae]
MLISLIIITAITHIFLANNRSNTLNRQLGLMQEAARFAINKMVSDLYMAGYTGCIKQTQIGNALRSSLTTHEWLTNNHKVQGLSLSDTQSKIDTSSITEGLTIFKLNPDVAFEVTRDNTGSNTLTLNSDASNLLAADRPVGLIRQDCYQVSLITLSSVSTTNIQYSAGSGTNFQNCTVQLKGNFRCYDSSSSTGITSFNPGYVIPLDSVAYYIRMENDLPTLFRKDVENINGIPLVDGIENMRIYYGLDTNDDGAANQYIGAGDRTYRHVDWHTVTSVKIHLLVRSETPVVPIDVAPIDYFFDGATITPPPDASGDADRYLRREYTMTVALRN